MCIHAHVPLVCIYCSDGSISLGGVCINVTDGSVQRTSRGVTLGNCFHLSNFSFALQASKWIAFLVLCLGWLMLGTEPVCCWELKGSHWGVWKQSWESWTTMCTLSPAHCKHKQFSKQKHAWLLRSLIWPCHWHGSIDLVFKFCLFLSPWFCFEAKEVAGDVPAL